MPDPIPEPHHGAGPAPADPPQDVIQDPDIAVISDVDEMPEPEEAV